MLIKSAAQKSVTVIELLHRSLKILRRYKYTINYTKVPQLNEDDLEERHVRGSGPGGQAVNKTANAVVLRHKPTGLVIKCHETRSLEQNRKLARDHLIKKLDDLINKEQSISAQEQQLRLKKNINVQQKRGKLSKLKEEWKERENVT